MLYLLCVTHESIVHRNKELVKKITPLAYISLGFRAYRDLCYTQYNTYRCISVCLVYLDCYA